MGSSFKNAKQSNNFSKRTFFFWFSSCSSLDKYKDTGIVHQLTKTAIIIAAAMKKHIKQFILPKDIFVNLLIEKTWV